MYSFMPDTVSLYGLGYFTKPFIITSLVRMILANGIDCTDVDRMFNALKVHG